MPVVDVVGRPGVGNGQAHVAVYRWDFEVLEQPHEVGVVIVVHYHETDVDGGRTGEGGWVGDGDGVGVTTKSVCNQGAKRRVEIC